ncbi:hypothetical protein [Chamaesiphon polymorphus]|uniref:Uncharacterized protein n=1 Tax=Chamaesiphon polymorphus CCALA 037 TaxID=2107692 RepID=A0A2T1G3X6_9CYAN|nr:hypothetical protein [Chamaesiphon polymorphus]PSB51934.1 hypothetical protein C7B77_21015 [Chamaesiphon polymorphus CCALA 037]
MRATSGKLTRFLPLCLGIISTIILTSALVPGRLEHHSSDIFLSLALWVGLPLLYLGVSILAIRDIYYLFSSRRKERKRRQLSGVLSLSILLITSILLSLDVPTRLYFFTSNKQFQQVLTQKVLPDRNYESIKKVGNFKIADIVVDNNGSDKPEAKSVYFVTRNVPDWIDIDRYGFAYLPDRSKTFATSTRHLYGKWYTFFQKGN